MNFFAGAKDRKKFETNNKTTAANDFFPPNNNDKLEQLRQTHISKHNSQREHPEILVMIADSEK